MSWFPKLLVKPFVIKPRERSQLLTPFATFTSTAEPELALLGVGVSIKPLGSTETDVG